MHLPQGTALPATKVALSSNYYSSTIIFIFNFYFLWCVRLSRL